VAPYYACKFGLNRLITDGDIRQKTAITAILENVVIAIYRLRPIQLSLTCCAKITAVYQNVLNSQMRLASTTFALILSLAFRLRYDYDEKLTCSFFVRVESRRMEAGARDAS